MQEGIENNCVGFVYNIHNLIAEEKFIEPPTWKEIQKLFTQVEDISSADILAIVDFSRPKPTVVHLGIISSDKKSVIHRKGINLPVEVDDLDQTIKELVTQDLDIARKACFLAVKKQQ
jgi:hypothetical protein